MLLWKAVWTSISRGCCSIGWEPEDVAGGPAVRRPRSGGRPLRLWAAPEAHPVWRCPSGSVWRTGALANGFSGKTKLLKNRPYGGHYPTQSALALLESSCKILATASLGNYPKRSPIFAEWKGLCVIPAQAAVQAIGSFTFWIPAFAGMTPLTRRRLCRRRPLPHQGRGVLGPLTRRRLCRRRPLDGQGRGVLGPVFHCCEGRSPGKHQHDGQFFRGKDTQADRANGPGHPPIGGFSLLKIFPQFACIPSTPNYNRLLLE